MVSAGEVSGDLHGGALVTALRTLAPELTILAPVRDRAFKRPDQLKYLEDRKLTIPPHGAAYSINRGLWGVTIGGTETLTSAGSIPDSAWVLSRDAFTKRYPNPASPKLNASIVSPPGNSYRESICAANRIGAAGASLGL